MKAESAAAICAGLAASAFVWAPLAVASHAAVLIGAATAAFCPEYEAKVTGG